MIFKAIIGMGLGLLMKPLCTLAAEKLLKARGRNYREKRAEKLAFAGGLALYGAAALITSASLWETIYLLLMAFPAATLALTDLHCRIIPNELVLAIILLSLIFGIPAQFGAPGFPAFSILQSFIGLAACLFIFTLPAVLHKNVGAGDVKLAAAMGFALGFENSLLAIVLMGGLILGGMFLQNRMPAVEYMKSQIPMGPFLSASMAAVLIVTRVIAP